MPKSHAKRLHTDREILRALYDTYYADYPAKGEQFVPVDLKAVAGKLGCDPHMLYGRLYFDMGTRLRWRDPKDPNVTLASIFEPLAGPQRHVVNFPYLAAVLARLDAEAKQATWTRVLAIVAIVVSVLTAASRMFGR